jgi:MFS family permease
MTQTEPRRGSGTFASLHSRNYRLFFFGQLVSVIGSWLHQVAETWFVYRITDSGAAVGMVMASRFVPVLALGLWGGSLADRYDRRRLLLVTQALRGACAGVLGVLALADVARPSVVYVLAFLAGVSNAVDNPVRRAFISQLVDEDDLLNAVSLTSSVMSASRVVGPLLAGVMIATVGVGWCFVINAVSYVAVLLALWAMDPSRFRPVPRTKRAGSVRDGLRYARSTPTLFVPLVMVGVVSATAWNWETLLALHATKNLGGGERLFTVLFATMSVGTLLGALFNASRKRVTHDQLVWMAAGVGVAMLGVAVVPGIPLTMVMLLCSGIGAAVFNTASSTVIQLTSSSEYHGRVMAMFSVLFVGTKGIGGAVAGIVSETAGVRWAIALGAAVCLVLAVWARAATAASVGEPVPAR